MQRRRILQAMTTTAATGDLLLATDGLRALNIVDAMLASAAQSGVWTRVGT